MLQVVMGEVFATWAIWSRTRNFIFKFKIPGFWTARAAKCAAIRLCAEASRSKTGRFLRLGASGEALNSATLRRAMRAHRDSRVGGQRMG
jgi:hypothetical protein